MIKQLYEAGNSEVQGKLKCFELATLKNTGILRISGGFAEAEIVDWDEENFFITLLWGVQNDCENRVNSENWKMNRETLELTE